MTSYYTGWDRKFQLWDLSATLQLAKLWTRLETSYSMSFAIFFIFNLKDFLNYWDWIRKRCSAIMMSKDLHGLLGPFFFITSLERPSYVVNFVNLYSYIRPILQLIKWQSSEFWRSISRIEETMKIELHRSNKYNTMYSEVTIHVRILWSCMYPS